MTDEATTLPPAVLPAIPAGVGVGIIAPGGYAREPESIDRGMALLVSQGCHVRNYSRFDDRYQRFSATDALRLDQMEVAFADPDIHIVMALRGAYGTTRLLPMLDLTSIAASNKLLVGYSDVTALHLALLAKTGQVSFAGPMLTGDFGCEAPSAFTISQFWAVMTSPAHTIIAQTADNPSVAIAGQLWGGNLTVLCNLLGTSYFPEIENGILFLEDVNEHPYRVERMLLQLEYAGVLARQKAVLLGDFANYRLTDYDNGYTFDTMVDYLRTKLSVPILTGLPFGHVKDRVTLPVGAQAALTSDANSFALTVSAYPFLAR